MLLRRELLSLRLIASVPQGLSVSLSPEIHDRVHYTTNLASTITQCPVEISSACANSGISHLLPSRLGNPALFLSGFGSRAVGTVKRRGTLRRVFFERALR